MVNNLLLWEQNLRRHDGPTSLSLSVSILISSSYLSSFWEHYRERETISLTTHYLSGSKSLYPQGPIHLYSRSVKAGFQGCTKCCVPFKASNKNFKQTFEYLQHCVLGHPIWSPFKLKQVHSHDPWSSRRLRSELATFKFFSTAL